MRRGYFSSACPDKAVIPLLIASLSVIVAACTTSPEAVKPSAQHLALPDTATPSTIPALAENAPLPPPPVQTKSAERYSIVVNRVPAQEILFALARDAKLNIEIHPDIAGTVTMNLIDQTLTEILDAVGRQVDMRYELNGRNLAIMPDLPYLKNYQIDYPNISREAKNNISIATSVATIGSGQTGGAGGSSGSNASGSSILNESNNHFWKTLVENIKDLLRETDKALPDGSSETIVEQNNQQQATPQPTNAKAGATGKAMAALPAQLQNQGSSVTRRVTYREAASVIANPETGIISVRATSRQHASVRDFIDKVSVSSHRQVLIEATVVEVALSDQYQQGIDWSSLSTSSTRGLNLTQVTPTGALTGSMGTLNYVFSGAFGGTVDLSATIKLLESFGKLHVLSSPKLSVLNNQTSLLKVVDEAVYFTIDVTPAEYNSQGVQTSPATYSTKVYTVPVGFLMYVTPQIGGNDEVTLNLRPTITRIIGYASDPNPVLVQNNLTNLIPQIQTREMESILRVRNGEIAVLGGLMQDTRAGQTNQIPGLGSLFGIGEAFKSRNDKNTKSELVIFLRPIILNQENQHDMLRLYKNSASQAEWQMRQIDREKAVP